MTKEAAIVSGQWRVADDPPRQLLVVILDREGGSCGWRFIRTVERRPESPPSRSIGSRGTSVILHRLPFTAL